MNTLLVTAGGTWEPVDAVRMLGNRSTGATGLAIARAAHVRGWAVTLLLSQHSPVAGTGGAVTPFEVIRFSSHRDLDQQMRERIGPEGPTALIHSAAVADYQVAGIYPGNADGPQADSNRVFTPDQKVPGGQEALWLKLTPLPKILAKIRNEWRYSGLLVSFKLEQGADLLARARENLLSSGSDLVVANTWEQHTREAFFVMPSLGAAGSPGGGRKNSDESVEVQRIAREELPERMMNFLESRLSR